MFGFPPKEDIDDVFNGDELLEIIKSKMKPGSGICPEDMVNLSRIVFEQGIRSGVEWCEIRMASERKRIDEILNAMSETEGLQ